MAKAELLRQITTRITNSCLGCIHYEVCMFLAVIDANELDGKINLAQICKHAEEIIVQTNQEKTK